MGRIIKGHNDKVLRQNSSQEQEKCNCIAKNECPLPGRCTVKNVVYEAKVQTQREVKTYVGLTSTTFKTRYNQHKNSFRVKTTVVCPDMKQGKKASLFEREGNKCVCEFLE